MLGVTFKVPEGHFNTRKLQLMRVRLDALIEVMGSSSQKTVALYPRDYDALHRNAKKLCELRGVAMPNALEYRGVILTRGPE